MGSTKATGAVEVCVVGAGPVGGMRESLPQRLISGRNRASIFRRQLLKVEFCELPQCGIGVKRSRGALIVREREPWGER